jgi:hypothetical protein
MKNTCSHCGSVYERPPSLLGSFCSKACGYAARKKENTTVRRIRYAPDHPLAGKGYISEARAVLYAKIGPEPTTCHWCGTRIEWLVGVRGNAKGAIIADHANNNPLDDSPENLVPACGPCNGIRTQRIKPDEHFVTNSNGTRTRAIERTCAACGEPFLVPPSALNRPNKGLYCSKSCARTGPRANSALTKYLARVNAEKAQELPQSKHCPTCTCCDTTL